VTLEFRAPAVAIMVLHAPIQGRKPGRKIAKVSNVFLRDLELQDTAQSAVGGKEKPPRWSGPPRRVVSPFSQAVQRSKARLPLMRNKMSKPPGLSGMDLRAASTLMVLNHHAQLLDFTMEVLV
jgi:hypothetical protein